MRAEDLRIETVNPAPKGGQHVGVITTRVRITHVPTGLVAECGAERSQMLNRNIVMAMIESGLAELEAQGCE